MSIRLSLPIRQKMWWSYYYQSILWGVYQSKQYLYLSRFASMELFKMIILCFVMIHLGICVVDSFQIEGLQGGIQFADIGFNQINRKIAPMLKTKYLGKFDGIIQNSFTGIVWGLRLKAFVAMPVRLNYKKCRTLINVIFKVDNSSPVTILNEQVIDKLLDNCPSFENRQKFIYNVQIGGRQHGAYSLHHQTYNLNVLGADFMRAVNGRLTIDYSKDLQEKVKLQFDVNVQKQDQQEQEQKEQNEQQDED